MASSNQTSHYALNQWEPDDSVLREDFNADNSKIDQALATLGAGVYAQTPIFGSYYGTGASKTQEIDLGFRPTVVLLTPAGGYYVSTKKLDFALITPELDSELMARTETGFTVASALNYADGTGQTHEAYKNPYRFIAFR